MGSFLCESLESELKKKPWLAQCRKPSWVTSSSGSISAEHAVSPRTIGYSQALVCIIVMIVDIISFCFMT